MKTIPLTQGKEAIVDDEDYNELIKYKWYFDNNYAITKIDGKNTIMGRFLLDPKDGMEVMYINDTLNNQRKNIKLAKRGLIINNSKMFNTNTTGYRGVYPVPRVACTKYVAQITVNHKGIGLGTFENARDAAIAYNEAALK